jgi:hypothetical protein
MDVQTARTAIEAILAAIPDSNLPEFDRVEMDGDTPIVWCGGSGRHLGSAKRNGIREPSVYRSRASWEAIHGEMVYRADRRLLDNGDDPTAIHFAAEVSE